MNSLVCNGNRKQAFWFPLSFGEAALSPHNRLEHTRSLTPVGCRNSFPHAGVETAEVTGKAPDLLSALHTIDRYPPDLSHPIFAHYPAMKFGERRAVEYFAQKLERNALAIGGDVLTGPPVQGLPSGANLICQALHRRLGMEIEVLRVMDPPDTFESETEFAAYGDYARLDYAARRAMNADQDVAFDVVKLKGREIVFVNDINVTGSQMERMKALLEKAQPRAIHWLLIVDVVPHIGRRFPHLESEINHSRFAESDELVAFLRGADLTFTGKIVTRLLSFSIENWSRVCRSLDRATRRAIREAILTDGAYSGEAFREKLAIL